MFEWHTHLSRFKSALQTNFYYSWPIQSFSLFTWDPDFIWQCLRYCSTYHLFLFSTIPSLFAVLWQSNILQSCNQLPSTLPDQSSCLVCDLIFWFYRSWDLPSCHHILHQREWSTWKSISLFENRCSKFWLFLFLEHTYVPYSSAQIQSRSTFPS